jgi:peptide/nickel transport system substrate-binding protein
MPFFCPIATNTPPRQIDDPLGSGPYYVASRVPNRQVVLERNRFYSGPRPAYVDRTVWTMTGGREACRVAVEQDQLDYCAGAGIPSEDYAEIVPKYGINRKGGQFFFNPTLSMGFLAFNHDRPAFKGSRQISLKQAINWAIDRPALVRASGFLGGKRTDQILPLALGHDTRLYPLGGVTERTLAKARTLLSRARVKPARLVLYAPNFEPPALQAQIVGFDLRRLGIDVEIQYFDNGALFGKLGTRGEPFDMVLTAWVPDYGDGVAFFGPLLDGNNITPTDSTNFAYFDRPTYNHEIGRIERLRGSARREAWAELDVEMMRDDPPFAPIYNGVKRDLVSRSFGCYLYHPVYGLDIAAACKK